MGQIGGREVSDSKLHGTYWTPVAGPTRDGDRFFGSTDGRVVSTKATDEAFVLLAKRIAEMGGQPDFFMVPGAEYYDGKLHVIDEEQSEKWRTAVTGEK